MSISNPLSIAPVLLWSVVEETVATLVVNGPILRVLIFRGQSFASSSGHDTRGYTRDRSTASGPYELRQGKSFMTVVEAGQDYDSTEELHDGVMKTVQVTVLTEDAKVKDDNSSASSTFVTQV